MDSIMESKRKCKSHNEAKKSCKVVAVDEKIKILDKLRGGMSAAAVDLTFRWYVILKSNFPLILYFNAYLSDDTLLYFTVCSFINIITV
jgi:hypothetical protein